MPSKQPKKGWLWLNDGSCVRLRPAYQNHVWSYDFVHCRTDEGRAFRALNILDEFSRECLAIRVRRKLNSTGVIDALTDLFILRGPPAFIRSDNGPEFAAEAVRAWIETGVVVVRNTLATAEGFGQPVLDFSQKRDVLRIDSQVPEGCATRQADSMFRR